MLKLTKTGIGLLTRQYRSVLKKCWLLNMGLLSICYVIDVANASYVFEEIGGNESGLWLYAPGYTYRAAPYSIHLGARSNEGSFLNVRNSIGNFVAEMDAAEGFGRLNLFSADGNASSTFTYQQLTINNMVNLSSVGGFGSLTMTNPSAGYKSVYDDFSLRYYKTVGGSYVEKTALSSDSFKLNGSTEMTGITHNTTVAADSSSTVAKLVSESTLARSLNNYYRKNKKSGILNRFEEGEKDDI